MNLLDVSTPVPERWLAAGAALDRYRAVRRRTEMLCRPLEVEDYVVSSMTDVSPTKWHLAHTSWFFETFVLREHAERYSTPDPRYAHLFNSYYVQAGERHCRARRGLVTRPTVSQVFAYRAHVDEGMTALLHRIGRDEEHPAFPLIELGLHHEQQHQELMLTDIKHVFWTNPLRPAYAGQQAPAPPSPSAAWMVIPEGMRVIGHDGPGFCFDNETPAHRAFMDGFALASRLVTNASYLDFMGDGGYSRPELWLASGWDIIQSRRWDSPLYWERADGTWNVFTLSGMQPLNPHEPVCHVSFYEAEAFARWAGHRLPREGEWEVAAAGFPVQGHLVESHRFHPAAASQQDEEPLQQLYGETWQWTQSPYVAYPGYTAPAGAIGEYNGKWMADQWVLRGASCATPEAHARLTYRNFFPAATRWQFSGIRLARDT